jgi:hypothetical protein
MGFEYIKSGETGLLIAGWVIAGWDAGLSVFEKMAGEKAGPLFEKGDGAIGSRAGPQAYIKSEPGELSFVAESCLISFEIGTDRL